MWGRVAVVALVAAAVLGGVGMYWLQVHAFYGDVETGGVIELTTNAGNVEAIAADEVREIDAPSSPLRYRACFVTAMSEAILTETYVVYDMPLPTVAPDWFDCFDARALGRALEEGNAIAFLGRANVEYGFDRVVAVDTRGRGFAWHQINPCGEAVFDGDPLPADCPEPPRRDE